jgi:hypothetical protein
LWGVLYSGIIVYTSSHHFSSEPLAIPFAAKDSFLVPSEVIGGLAFVGALYMMYRWVAGLARKAVI